MEQFSIAEAHNRFTEIVCMAESGKPVHLLRRGKVVLVVLSIRGYQHLAKQRDFWRPLARMREQIEGGEREGVRPYVFAGLRERSMGRDAA